MKIKKILSSLLAATMLFGSVTANAVTIESDDTPKRSGVAVESDDMPKRSGSSLEQVRSRTTAVDKSLYDLPEKIEDGAILHAWSWSCATIEANMERIAAAGYTAVQTSPMARCYSVYDGDYLIGEYKRI